MNITENSTLYAELVNSFSANSEKLQEFDNKRKTIFVNLRKNLRSSNREGTLSNLDEFIALIKTEYSLLEETVPKFNKIWIEFKELSKINSFGDEFEKMFETVFSILPNQILMMHNELYSSFSVKLIGFKNDLETFKIDADGTALRMLKRVMSNSLSKKYNGKKIDRKDLQNLVIKFKKEFKIFLEYDFANLPNAVTNKERESLWKIIVTIIASISFIGLGILFSSNWFFIGLGMVLISGGIMGLIEGTTSLLNYKSEKPLEFEINFLNWLKPTSCPLLQK